MKRYYLFALIMLCFFTLFTTPVSAQHNKLISLDSLGKSAAINAIYVSQILYNNQNYITHIKESQQNEADKEFIKNTFVQAIAYYAGSNNKSITPILQKYPAINALYVSYFFSSLTDSEIYNTIRINENELKGEAATQIKMLYDKITENNNKINGIKNVTRIIPNIQSLKDNITALSLRIASRYPTLKADSFNNTTIDSIYAVANSLLTNITRTEISDTNNALKSYILSTNIKDSLNNLISTVETIRTQVDSSLLVYADDIKMKELLAYYENDTKTLFSQLKIELLKLASSPDVAKSSMFSRILPGKDREFKVKANYFLTALESNYSATNTSNQFSFFSEYISNKPATSSFSLPSQSEMIDAVAVFLAKRAKQEAILWFFEQLREKSKINKEINIFFPECMALLNNEEVYEMPEMGKAWRYAIAKDFVNMPTNFFKSPFVDSIFRKNGIYTDQLAEYVYYANYIAQLMQKKYSTDDLINNLYINLKDNNLSNRKITPGHFITLLYAIKQEFYLVKDNNKQWLHPSILMDMPDEVFKTMLSLTDLKYSGVISKLLLPEGKPFDLTPVQLNQVRRLMSKILQSMQQIQNITTDLKHTGRENTDNEIESFNHSIWQFTNELITNFDEILIISRNPRVYDTSQIFSLQTNLYLLREILTVYSLIDKKNYNNAVSKTFDIVLTLLNNNKNSERIQSLLIDINKTINKGKENKKEIDFLTLNARLTRLKTRINTPIDYKSNPNKPYPFLNTYNATRKANDPDSASLLAKYLSYDKTRAFIINTTSFLSDVSTAKSSQDLSKVISAYALPPTSYKMKRNTWNSIFINAYVGMYAGYEQLTNSQFKNNNLNDSIKTGWVYGVSAPIGLSFSKTFGGKRKTEPTTMDAKYYPKGGKYRFRDMSKSTITFFVSIIDLGAIVSFRFNNTQGTLPQDFKWGQFISPGVHLQYGIPSTPLVFSTGVAYTPQVRKVDVTVTAQPEQFNALRYYAGLFFDIPLLKVHSKEKFKGLKTE